jgi:hypothetical protein
MTVGSVRQTAPLRADLLAATAALNQKAGGRAQLNPSSSIDNAALSRIYQPIPRRSNQTDRQLDPPQLRSPRSPI